MNKDVIYIDVEDDITAIINKVKSSGEKIIALVPPKRIGVLQSAVNLRLLQRAATSSDKRLVLITNNTALMSLAASAAIPVAKNLQSKPELAEISALEIDDGDDVIDGKDLPVGEHAASSGVVSPDEVILDEAVDEIEAEPSAKKPVAPRKSAKKGAKVPNFNTFRKKLVLGFAAGIALIFFLVWAVVIAPHATVVIAARTSSSSVNTDVLVADNVSTSTEKSTLKAVIASQSDDISEEFTPTGTKNAGNKASGTVNISNQSLSATSIAAGTRLATSGGLVFVTNEEATIPASTVGPGCFPTACPGSTTVGVTAAEAGAKYNAASGNLSGAPNNASASLTGPTSGGTDKIVKVVTQADIVKAKQALVDKKTDDIKQDLKKEFEGEVISLEDTFQVDYGKVTSSPSAGSEASGGKASLTGEVVYKMYGVEKSELDDFLKQTLETKLDESSSQRIYDSGASKAQFQDVSKKDNGAEATLVATGHIGPKIDESDIKERAKGKKFGDIQADIQSIQGVKSVDVKFFPFWVSTVPNDIKKISVEFKLDESN